MRDDGHELCYEKNISEVEYEYVEHEVDESLYSRCFAYKIKKQDSNQSENRVTVLIFCDCYDLLLWR